MILRNSLIIIVRYMMAQKVMMSGNYALSALQAQMLQVYEPISRQDTNSSLVTGLRCKPYTRNPFDYRRLCELVLGCRVFREK